MIHTLRMQHFRCHRDIELRNLGQINLLTGMNNTGKSVALEALFLLSFSLYPATALEQLKHLRGFGRNGDQDEFLDSLFYEWDATQEIVIAAEERPVNALHDERSARLLPGWRTLRIRSVLDEEVNPAAFDFSTDPPGIIDEILIYHVRDLIFHFEPPSGEPVKLSLRRGNLSAPEKDSFFGSSRRRTRPIRSNNEYTITFIPAGRMTSQEQEAQRYSRLEVMGRQQEVLAILQVVEPRLQRLVVVATSGRSVIYGDLGASRLVPLSTMGDGITRVLTIALAIANARSGLVLIDEVESGLHYSVMVDVWRMIAEAAQRLHVQVFATTHSDECIRAASEAMPSPTLEPVLKLYRFDRTPTGTRVVDYSAGELVAAIASEQEVR